jgi:hypothetical protein
MKERTQEQINAEIRALSHDCVGPHDPEAARQTVLRMGGSIEEADQTARFWEEENRRNGYTLEKAS